MPYKNCSECNRPFYTFLSFEEEDAAITKIIDAVRPLGVTFDTAINLLKAAQVRLQSMATFLPLGPE